MRGIVKASLSDIKENSFIGVTGMPQADGSQKAVEIHIFPESMRGTGEGYRPWDLLPSSTMTNATVAQIVKGVQGEEITSSTRRGEENSRRARNGDRRPMCPATRASSSRARRFLSRRPTRRRRARYEAAAVSVGRKGSRHRCKDFSAFVQREGARRRAGLWALPRAGTSRLLARTSGNCAGAARRGGLRRPRARLSTFSSCGRLTASARAKRFDWWVHVSVKRREQESEIVKLVAQQRE